MTKTSRKPAAFNGAAPAAFDHDNSGAPGGSLPKGTVSVTVTEAGAGQIHDGKGGTYDVRRVIPVTEAQAASLKAQGYAE